MDAAGRVESLGVCVSPKRFSNLQVLEDGLSVVVMGAANESITVSFRDADGRIVHRGVQFGQSGGDQVLVAS